MQPSICTIYLDMYEQSLAKLLGSIMATGPHSRLDTEVETCSTCEAKRKEVNGHHGLKS